jgi:hypothetical protein
MDSGSLRIAGEVDAMKSRVGGEKTKERSKSRSKSKSKK